MKTSDQRLRACYLRATAGTGVLISAWITPLRNPTSSLSNYLRSNISSHTRGRARKPESLDASVALRRRQSIS
jgi:hypothetical protein